MKTRCFPAALLVVPLLAIPAAVQARGHESRIGIVGREIAAPPWSAACMTDHGPSQCDEPMWIYGSPREVARYRSAF